VVQQPEVCDRRLAQQLEGPGRELF
jgi:hypothetical protein